MAALETPWLDSMSSTSTYIPENGPTSPKQSYDPNPPTVAAFSPSTISGTSIATKQRSTIIVHKKSPLLVATPPQVTRALAYSHPFLLPLNKLAGLLSWSSGDPWESFLMVAGFWAIALYGDDLVRWTGPIMIVIGLIVGMYSRRYSPLSSTEWTGEKRGHKRQDSEGASKHHKTLDEILETLREFTTRCQILLDPMLRLTEFLSTQRTPTSATTRPALTVLFIRILLVTPVWILLTLPPLYIITTRRVVLSFGTIALTWHSSPARVSRVILWRSLTVRKICAVITGLTFSEDPEETQATTSTADGHPLLPPRRKSQQLVAKDVAQKRRPDSSGVRFTFILFENQRRWLGIGWTYSLLAYERAAWTDEQLNAAPSKDEFELPEVEGAGSRWRWVEGSEWRIEGADSKGKGTAPPKDSDGGGWIYYDNKWNDGRRGEDSWGRYTRRRKWYRDAELVEITPSTEATPSHTPNAEHSDAEENSHAQPTKRAHSNSNASHTSTQSGGDYPSIDSTIKEDDSSSVKARKKGWFGGGRRNSKGSLKNSEKASIGSGNTGRTDRDEGMDVLDKWNSRTSREEDWGVNDDVRMGLS